MAVGDRGRSLAPVRVVSLSLLFGAAAVLAGLALSGGRMASAQAPDQAYWLPADSAIDGDEFLVPPDSEVGLPIIWPPGGGFLPLGGQGDPTVTFLHPPYPGATQAVLCPLKKPPDNRGAWLSASCKPFGGTCPEPWYYDPVMDVWQETYTSTDNNLNTCLTHTENLTYTVNEKQASGESGYIRVFDADLTLAGGSSDQQDTVEDDPGFFMAVGGARKLLTLRLQPSEPEDVFPAGSMDWWEEDPWPPPPYSTGLSAGGPGGVSFYSQAESGDALTDLGWGWQEVAPYGQPYEFEEISTPTQLYVQADTPGTCTISFGLTYDTYDICWPPVTSADDHVKVTVVAITESANPQPDPDRKLWWFNGENAANYAEQVTLTAQGITEGTFCWTVVAGADKVDLGNGHDTQTKVDDNTVMVISTGESYPQNDVEITLRINGQDAATHKLTVYTPGDLLLNRSDDVADGTWGYLTSIWYAVRDQFEDNLPAAQIEVNERWTTDIVPDYPGMDWRRGDPGAAMVDPRSWRDSIQGELAGHNPEPQVPQTPRGTTGVYHWGQGWYVGSMTIGSGKHVQTNVLQKYRDHARHE